MAQRIFLRFSIRGFAEDLVFEVRQHVSDRLALNLDRADRPDQPGFFYFDTVDGRCVAINLADVQAIRYLWEPSELPPDEIRHDGGIEIRLRGRLDPICAYTEAPETLFDFFMELENFPHGAAFPAFEGEDGELLQVNANQVVIAIAPSHLVDAGRTLGEDENLPPTSGSLN